MNSSYVTGPFRKSSHSGGASNDCVEVACTREGGRAVRDSKVPRRGAQYHSAEQWAVFISALKNDAFDH
ncbi:DUF397 domain-containing protein [Streptomyces zingiberis]|uniref:DUF397 domain-containing protein n=1 Tax=Streptomyces zingiberis TaxID=2053010 RepID=A0ABX1BWQ6_9ACTN|nr:DUF397 domain-containing protein [Streptomyces zingiberis]NJQ00708.1 DUF397 domain-containing protein [Streptomyces zingiberis]